MPRYNFIQQVMFARHVKLSKSSALARYYNITTNRFLKSCLHSLFYSLRFRKQANHENENARKDIVPESFKADVNPYLGNVPGN